MAAVTDWTGWNPVDVRRDGGEPVVEWAFTGDLRFTDSFFSETVSRARFANYGKAELKPRQTTMAEASAVLVESPGLEPSGFIFHMTRCGSTLAAQMLGAAPRNRVLSEPTALGHWTIDAELARADRLKWLRTMVGLLGRPLAGESNLFIKTDCWHALDLPLFVEAFPRTPWIFLHRDAAEVLVSQLRQPGEWTVAGIMDSKYFGLDRETAIGMGRTDYVAHQLARICSAARQYRDCGRGMMVDYDRLPGFVMNELPEHFGLKLSAAEAAAMAQAGAMNAKNTQERFSSDRASKRSGLTAEVRAAIERRAPEYAF